MTEAKAYDFRDSPLFRLRSRSKLADILFISQEKLEKLANLERKKSYYEFKKIKKNGEFRDISAPIEPLKQVQKRLSILLSRIAPPDYLFAPVSGRSYVDNAARHIGAESVHLLNIENFFPSCTARKAAWLFGKKMECSPDVTAILCKLVTSDGCLPQGSPASPILAYLCYYEMWSEVQAHVAESDCRLSVYADDLTISGHVVPKSMVWKVKQTLFRHGHRHAKAKEQSRRGKPAEITGVIVSRDGVSAPNRQHRRIHEIRGELRSAIDEDAQSLHRKLSGRLAQLAQINAGNPGNTGMS